MRIDQTGNDEFALEINDLSAGWDLNFILRAGFFNFIALDQDHGIRYGLITIAVDKCGSHQCFVSLAMAYGQ